MADDTQGAAAPQPRTAPSMNLVGQYIRDLSFENPGAPATLMGGGANPAFNVSISVGVKKQSDEIYAIELTLNAKANREETVLFNVELVYGGIFRIKNVPENQLSPLLMIECPRMLFPYLRRIVSDVTRDGGYPPLNLENIDFLQIYRAELARRQAAKAETPTTA